MQRIYKTCRISKRNLFKDMNSDYLVSSAMPMKLSLSSRPDNFVKPLKTPRISPSELRNDCPRRKWDWKCEWERE